MSLPTKHPLANASLPSYLFKPHPNPPYSRAILLSPAAGDKYEHNLTWTITPARELPGHWYISTTLPSGQPKRLDILNDGGDRARPRLADPGFYAGQLWRMTPVPCAGEKEREGVWCRLSNEWTGDGWYLDVDGEGLVRMTEGIRDGEGQVWWVGIGAEETMEMQRTERCDVEAQRGQVAGRKGFGMLALALAVLLGFACGRLSFTLM